MSGCISFKILPINTKFEDFVNLGFLFFLLFRDLIELGNDLINFGKENCTLVLKKWLSF